MPAANAQAVSNQGHHEALLARHHELEARIHEVRRSPSVSDQYLRDLKKRKLRIKEELEKMRD